MAADNEFLEQLQARLAADPTADWTAAETSISRLSEEERRMRLGYVPGPYDLSLEEREQLSEEHRDAVRAADAGDPPEWNWTNMNGIAQSFIDPVRDQLTCGSCVAFGVTATMEGVARIAMNIAYNDPNGYVLPVLSPAHLFYCGGSRGCNGGWDPDGAYSFAGRKGVVPETCFPYTPGDQPCNLCWGWGGKLTQISSCCRIYDVRQMKAMLRTGPLTTCMTAYEDFSCYTGGVYRHVWGDSGDGHCICVIGYNDWERAWLCKNSWGTNWGQIPRFSNEQNQPGLERGYFKIAYGECGIDAEMWMVNGFRQIYTTN